MHKLFLKNSTGDILTNSNGDAIYFSLPEAYEEVEYIESTGTQWFDSNITILAKTNIKCKVLWTNISGNYPMLYGAWSVFSLSSMPSGYFCIASGGRFNNPWSSGPTVSANTLYEIAHKPNTFTINGTEYTIPNAGTSNSNTDRHIIVFAASNQGNVPYNWSTYAKARMYYFKVYNEDELVNYLIPCYRKSDNVIGMYDLVNNVFYTNAGSGTFIKGPRIPEEYQEVEYIESSGTQYINTNCNITSEKMTVKFKCVFPRSTTGLSLFGSNSPYNLVPYSYGNRVFTHWVGTSSNFMSITYSDSVNVVTYTLNSGSIVCNLNDSITTSTYNGSIINTRPIYIFGKNGQGSSAERGSGYRLYYWKLYDNNHLLRNLIPCYRKSDNVIGMYDRIEDKFYTNSGTGTFTKGGNIN